MTLKSARLKQWGRRFVKWLLTLTSMKAGVIMVGLCVGVYVLPIVTGHTDNALMNFVISIDHRLFDTMFRLRGPIPPTGEVVIVDIDEKSLKELGQWPWPRTYLAQILRNLKEAGVKVVGMDIVFAEPDRSSPRNYAKYFEELAGKKFELEEGRLDNDMAFGDALAEEGLKVIVGYVFLTENDGLLNPDVTPPCPQYSEPLSGLSKRIRPADLRSAYRPVLDIPAIADNAISEGFFNMFPDPATGIVRKVPLFILFQGVLYPSLPLEMLREGLGPRPMVLSSEYNWGIKAVLIGDRVLRTDPDGQIAINYRGGQKTFPFYSAVDVYHGKVPKDALSDKYVLLGTSAPGLLDLRATPFDNAFPGVEVHANLIDNVLAGDPMFYDNFTQIGLTITVIMVAGLILSAILSYIGPVPGGIAGVGFLAIILVGNYRFFFLQNQFLGVTFPLLALLAIFIVVTLVNYLLEGREKRVVRGMFQTMVSGDVLKYMEAHPGSFSLKGEARKATMFFSDVAGFTTISESLTPEKLVQLLNAYLTPMTEIIMGSQGYVDKYEGDAIMAEWGVPFPSENHAELACFSALDQQVKLAEIREELFQRFGHRLFVRMGMNSGTVSAGNMGSTRRFSYTVMGDAVNQAARFEPANKDYGTDIMMGNLTYELAKDHIEARMIDKLVVKGKTEPILIHELIARKGQISADKAEIVALYVDALRVHWDRDFDGALERLRKVLHIDPSDGPAKALIERLEEYKVTPPPPTWKGEFVRTKKD